MRDLDDNASSLGTNTNGKKKEREHEEGEERHQQNTGEARKKVNKGKKI